MHLRAGLACSLVLLLTVQPAFPHNEIIHQNMIDLAYQTMVWAERFEGGSVVSRSVPPGWTEFQTRLAVAVSKLRARNSALSEMAAPQSLSCPEPVYEVKDLPAKWWDKPLGQVPFPPSIDFANNGSCGVRADWKAEGIFAKLGSPDAPYRDHTGVVLGLWASSVDRHKDDTHLWVRPTNVLGLGAVRNVVNDAGNTALGLVLLPVFCLVECIFGGCGDCANDAHKAADTLNPTDELEGWIPGIGDISGPDWIGVWHHINMNESASNEFDDHQGELFDEAGPPGMGMDAVDLVLMAAFDAGGISVNYDDSLGVHQYQITSTPDGSAQTRSRDKSQWQYTTIAHTAFEPVDNLAEYGWRRFFSSQEHAISNLAWPLHALGDATVPMHVVATSAWGHRPYEDSQEYIWTLITLQNRPEQEQVAFISRILQRAFFWDGKIREWRAAHGNSVDVPVRSIVSGVAADTHAYSMQMQSRTNGQWPFSGVASTTYLVEPSLTSKAYAATPGAADLARPLLEDGAGAAVALLMNATDSFPRQ